MGGNQANSRRVHAMRRGREIFQKYRAPLQIIASCLHAIPIGARQKLFEHYRMTKGMKGLAIRYVLLKSIAAHCGDNVSIHPGVYLLHPRNLSLGNNVSIHPMCYLECSGGQGGIRIGDDVSIAHSVSILAETHAFSDLHLPIKDQGVVSQPVHIRDDVWIGCKVTILGGVTLESGCVVGAGAVVTHDVPRQAVVAGVPAVIIGRRAVSAKRFGADSESTRTG